MTFSRVSKLATKFEKKLAKYAQTTSEVDSSNVTLAVRPAVNNALTTLKFNNLLQTALQGAVDKLFAANKELHGDVKISNFITNASLVGGKWKVDPAKTGLKVSGTLLTDPTAAAAIKAVVSKANATIIPLLEAQFNKQSQMDKEGWAGTTITNHDTDINEVNLDI